VFDAFTGSRHQLVIDPAIVSRHSSPVAFTSSRTSAQTVFSKRYD
jgi:hypothetical protein